MKALKKIFRPCFALAMIIIFLTGCGQLNTVESLVVSNEPYAAKEDIEDAVQPEQVSAGTDIYASIYFIESPKGMEYTGKWYLNGEEIKSDTQETITDKSGAVIYRLEADDVKKGSLQFEVFYNNELLISTEITVK